jgi:hypothetical protein
MTQLDSMYTSAQYIDAKMAYQALEAVTINKTKTAVAYGRRLITLASTAARGASMLQIDALAQ